MSWFTSWITLEVAPGVLVLVMLSHHFVRFDVASWVSLCCARWQSIAFWKCHNHLQSLQLAGTPCRLTSFLQLIPVPEVENWHDAEVATYRQASARVRCVHLCWLDCAQVPATVGDLVSLIIYIYVLQCLPCLGTQIRPIYVCVWMLLVQALCIYISLIALLAVSTGHNWVVVLHPHRRSPLFLLGSWSVVRWQCSIQLFCRITYVRTSATCSALLSACDDLSPPTKVCLRRRRLAASSCSFGSPSPLSNLCCCCCCCASSCGGYRSSSCSLPRFTCSHVSQLRQQPARRMFAASVWLSLNLSLMLLLGFI